MGFEPGLQVGDEISNKQLYQIFKCANSSGMRRSKKLGVLVIISDYTKGIYNDEWKGDVLHYTGMGQVGDQVLRGNQNYTLYHSNTNGVEVHLFEVFKKAVYTYRGIVKLAEKPYQTEQEDITSSKRKVWIFPVKLVHNSFEIEKENDIADRELLKSLDNISDQEIDWEYQYEPKPKEKDEPITRNNIKINKRNGKTALRALTVARFLCEVDSKHPSFIRKKVNVNYMEPHHLVPLEYSERYDVSLDVEANIISLCSNCHNQLHYGRDYLPILQELYERRKEQLMKAGIKVTFEELKEMYT